MKITFELDTTNAAHAALITTLLGIAPSSVAAAPAATAAPAKTETAAAKKKRITAEKKAAKTAAEVQAAEVQAAEAAEAAEADDLMDDGSGGEVTLDALKAVVKATIERTDIDQVKSVFKDFKAGKISDLATEAYGPVKLALEAL
jgi:membrane protein involved in colicin uptake